MAIRLVPVVGVCSHRVGPRGMAMVLVPVIGLGLGVWPVMGL